MEEKNNMNQVEPRDNYSPLGGSIKSASDKGKFVVKKGYSFFKIWVKAFDGSSNITCTVTKGSFTEKPIKQFTIMEGTNDAYIISCSEGTYCVSFSSAGNMNGQYNVKVATTRDELK